MLMLQAALRQLGNLPSLPYALHRSSATEASAAQTVVQVVVRMVVQMEVKVVVQTVAAQGIKTERKNQLCTPRRCNGKALWVTWRVGRAA